MPGVTASRADVLGTAAILTLSAAIVLGPRIVARLSAHPTATACEELLARYIELRERSVSEKLDPKGYAAALGEARELAGPSFAACTGEMTLEEADCARRANHVDEFERCLQ